MALPIPQRGTAWQEPGFARLHDTRILLRREDAAAPQGDKQHQLVSDPAGSALALQAVQSKEAMMRAVDYLLFAETGSLIYYARALLPALPNFVQAERIIVEDIEAGFQVQSHKAGIRWQWFSVS